MTLKNKDKSSNSSFSVLISVYRHDNPMFVKLSLDSIFSQTLFPDQVVLVVDGPISKDLKQVLNEFKSRHPIIMDIYPLEENIGLGPALNYGLLQCRNEIVARMDSDDINLPDRFQKQIDFLRENPDIDVLGCNVEEFDKQPGDLKRIKKSPYFRELYKYSRWRNPINHPTVIFRKSSILAVNSYENVPYFEDYYLWIKLIHHGYKIDNIQEILLYFRNNTDTMDRRRGWKYIMCEVNFLRRAYTNSYLEFEFFILSLLIRIPLRLVPKKALSIVYRNILRKLN